MSRLLLCRCRESYTELFKGLFRLKQARNVFSSSSMLRLSPYTARNLRMINSNCIPGIWVRNIQTETHSAGSNMPPFQPPKGEAAKKLSQAPPLPTQENLMEQTAKVLEMKGTTNIQKNVENSEGKKEVNKKVSAKPSLWVRIKEEALHYYHGFKLFFYEVKISTKLSGKILRGNSLTRREKRHLERTVADIFRLVPFSIFIIVPFMEFLLPFAIKIFPGLLPSTFQTMKTKDEKRRAELRVKLQMSKFLRKTMEEMSEKKEHKEGPTIQEFVEFFVLIRERGESAHVDDVIRFSQLFRDEFTLDNMTHAQLKALCKLVMINSVGTSALLRLQLNMCLRHLKADDNLIRNEGIDSMTVPELQSACQSRGMRAVGINEKKLKEQLLLWLNLHLDKQVPPSLLLLTQALTLKSQAPNTEGLEKTLSALPEELIDHLEAQVAKTPKTKLETLRNEQALIDKEKVEEEIHKKERLEKHASMKEEKAKSVSINLDSKEIPAASADTTHHKLTKEDVKSLSEAVDKLESMRESIADIKTEMAAPVPREAAKGEIPVDTEPEIKKTKAEKMLAKKVTSIIVDLEEQIHKLEEHTLSSDHISTADLKDTLLALKANLCPNKMEQVVNAIDLDSDGFIRKDNLQEIIQLIASEETDVSTAHVKQITELIDREHLSIKLKHGEHL